MKVNNISYLNLDDLYKIVVSKRNEPNYQKLEFKQNYGNLLSHMEITIVLEDVSRYEYFFLKQFATTVSKFVRNTDMIELESHAVSVFPKIQTSAINPLFALIKSIHTDEEVQESGDLLLPTSFIIGNCIASFTGNDLIRFVELNPLEFFIEGSKGKCVNEEDHTLRSEYVDQIYEDDDLKNYCVGKFIQGFYRFMVERFDRIDLASDSYIQMQYLNRTSEPISMSILSVRNPLFTVNFMDDGSDVINKAFQNGKDQYNLFGVHAVDDTSIEFGCNTSFGTFLSLYEVLPKDAFISMESISIPFRETFDTTQFPQYEKYNRRVAGRLETLINDIDTKYKDKENRIKHMGITMHYVPFKFIIKLTLSDVNTYILPLKESLNDKVLNRTQKELYDILNIILSYSISIYNYIK